jgi:hypothetical protein
MDTVITPSLKYALMRRALLATLGAWALIATLLLLLAEWRSKPQFIVVVETEFGVRQATDDKEVEEGEKLKFINQFFDFYYSYSPETYDHRAELAKKLMADQLRAEKEKEFTHVSAAIKSDPLTMSYAVLGAPRAVDPTTFEVDLNLEKKQGLVSTVIPLRVEVKLKRRERTMNNLFLWEVMSYVENPRI